MGSAILQASKTRFREVPTKGSTSAYFSVGAALPVQTWPAVPCRGDVESTLALGQKDGLRGEGVRNAVISFAKSGDSSEAARVLETPTSSLTKPKRKGKTKKSVKSFKFDIPATPMPTWEWDESYTETTTQSIATGGFDRFFKKAYDDIPDEFKPQPTPTPPKRKAKKKAKRRTKKSESIDVQDSESSGGDETSGEGPATPKAAPKKKSRKKKTVQSIGEQGSDAQVEPKAAPKRKASSKKKKKAKDKGIMITAGMIAERELNLNAPPSLGDAFKAGPLRASVRFSINNGTQFPRMIIETNGRSIANPKTIQRKADLTVKLMMKAGYRAYDTGMGMDYRHSFDGLFKELLKL